MLHLLFLGLGMVGSGRIIGLSIPGLENTFDDGRESLDISMQYKREEAGRG